MCGPSEIVQVVVGLKDVRVLYFARQARDMELVIEQVVTDPWCLACGNRARVKERPVVQLSICRSGSKS